MQRPAAALQDLGHRNETYYGRWKGARRTSMITGGPRNRGGIQHLGKVDDREHGRTCVGEKSDGIAAIRALICRHGVRVKAVGKSVPDAAGQPIFDCRSAATGCGRKIAFPAKALSVNGSARTEVAPITFQNLLTFPAKLISGTNVRCIMSFSP